MQTTIPQLLHPINKIKTDCQMKKINSFQLPKVTHDIPHELHKQYFNEDDAQQSLIQISRHEELLHHPDNFLHKLSKPKHRYQKLNMQPPKTRMNLQSPLPEQRTYRQSLDLFSSSREIVSVTNYLLIDHRKPEIQSKASSHCRTDRQQLQTQINRKVKYLFRSRRKSNELPMLNQTKDIFTTSFYCKKMNANRGEQV